MWPKVVNMYFCQIENFTKGEISKQSVSAPHHLFPLFAKDIKVLVCWGKGHIYCLTHA